MPHAGWHIPLSRLGRQLLQSPKCLRLIVVAKSHRQFVDSHPPCATWSTRHCVAKARRIKFVHGKRLFNQPCANDTSHGCRLRGNCGPVLLARHAGFSRMLRLLEREQSAKTISPLKGHRHEDLPHHPPRLRRILYRGNGRYLFCSNLDCRTAATRWHRSPRSHRGRVAASGCTNAHSAGANEFSSIV